MQDWLQQPHRRFNPLTGDWVLVSPQRESRPWQGQIERAEVPALPRYDPSCYLCPGNMRASGARNPAYESTFVFDNDFPALTAESRENSLATDGLYAAKSERGICRVVCFSPRHDLTLAQMGQLEVEHVVDTWRTQAAELESIPWISYVQIFENRGAMMGVSNPHPHCQIWASEHIPNQISKEQSAQSKYASDRGSCLLCSYLSHERESERVVCSNESFLAVVPFWAVWPFEILVGSRRHLGRFADFSPEELRDLASILRTVTHTYDKLFAVPFPYTMGFHPAPARSSDASWHFHAHYYPPLLRSATVRKFMVGYEMLAGPQRDLTPEAAARRLREISSEK